MDVSTMTTFGAEKAQEVAALVEDIKRHIEFVDRHSPSKLDTFSIFADAARTSVDNIAGVYGELVALNESWARKTSQLTEMEEACKQKGIELAAAYQQKERELEAAYQQKEMVLEATYQEKQEELRLKTEKAERQFSVLETATVEQEKSKVERESRKAELEQQLLERNRKIQDLELYANEREEAVQSQISSLESAKADLGIRNEELEKQLAEKGKDFEDLKRKAEDGAESLSKQLSTLENVSEDLKKTKVDTEDKFVEMEKKCAEAVAEVQELERKLKSKEDVEKQLADKDLMISELEAAFRVQQDKEAAAVAASVAAHRLEMEERLRAEFDAEKAQLLREREAHLQSAEVEAASRAKEAQEVQQKQIEDMRVQHQLDLVRAKGEFEATQVQTQVQNLSPVVAANGEQLSKELKALEDARGKMARVTQTAFLAADNAYDHLRLSERLRSRVENWHSDVVKRGAELDLREEALRVEAGTGDIFLHTLGGRMDQAFDHLGGRVDEALEQADDDRQNVMGAGKIILDFQNTLQELSEKINSLNEVKKMPGAKRDQEELSDVGPLRKKARTDSRGAYGLEVGESSTSQQAAMPREQTRKGKEVERRSPMARQVSDSPPIVPQMDDGRWSPSPVLSGSPRVGEADENEGDDMLEARQGLHVASTLPTEPHLSSSLPPRSASPVAPAVALGHYDEVLGWFDTPGVWDQRKFDNFKSAFRQKFADLSRDQLVTDIDSMVTGAPANGYGKRVCFLRPTGIKKKTNLPKGKDLDRAECPFHASADIEDLCVQVQFVAGLDKHSDHPQFGSQVGSYRWVVKDRT